MFITDMIYFIWFHGSVGQTPGKMLLGLRVIQASGEKMTFGVAFLRWVGTLVSGLFLSLGYLWIAIDGKKQGWHDKIAATLVIRTASESGPASPTHSTPLPETALTGQPQTDLPRDPQPHTRPLRRYHLPIQKRFDFKYTLTNGGIFYRKTFRFGGNAAEAGAGSSVGRATD